MIRDDDGTGHGTGTGTGTSTHALLANDECPGGDTCGVDATLLEAIKCPAGNCDPGTGNAQGLYTAVGDDHCFKGLDDVPFLCPEAFVTTQKGVSLVARRKDNPSVVILTPVSGRLEGSSTYFPVTAIHGDRTQLAIEYQSGGTKIAKGADVSKVILGLGGLPASLGGGDAFITIAYELQFVPDQQGKTATDKVSRYKLLYRDVGSANHPTNWVQHCQAKSDPAETFVVSFLQGQRVSATTGGVTKDSTVTTMGCESGSIVTCLAWGYTPWNVSTGQWDETRDFVYRSCIQAKRAAYFVGKGDFQSYTKKGTLILKRDQFHFGSGQDEIPHLEAIWGPQGAVCFNKENRRRKDADAWKGVTNDALLNTQGVPACSPADWNAQGKLATGPEKLQP